MPDRSNREAAETQEENVRPPTVLVCGLNQSIPAKSLIGTEVEVVGVDCLFRICEQTESAVLVLGPSLNDQSKHAVLSRISERRHHATMVIVVGVSSDSSLFQKFVDEDRIFYLCRGDLSGPQLSSIILAAQRFSVNPDFSKVFIEPLDEATAGWIHDLCDRMAAQPNLSNAAELLADTMRLQLNAQVCRVWTYDRARHLLWPVIGSSEQESPDSAVAGLVGFVARTGEHVNLERIGADARYDPESDNPGGNESIRFLAEAISGTAGETFGVISLTRVAEELSFSNTDALMLQTVAVCVAPFLEAQQIQARLQPQLSSRSGNGRPEEDTYLREALEHHSKGWAPEGDILRTYPSWLKKTHGITTVVFLAAFIFVAFAKVNQYAMGQGVIRARNKIAVTAPVSGVIDSVEVWSGDHVRQRGVLLVYRPTSDSEMGYGTKTTLRAPSDGLIGSIRVRSGQAITAGETLANIIDESAGYELIALLPATYATQIHKGMMVAVKLNGYAQARKELPIANVGVEILSPHESARYLGEEAPDVPRIAGPAIVVRALIADSAIREGNRQLIYRDGDVGVVQVKLEVTTILRNLVPGFNSRL